MSNVQLSAIQETVSDIVEKTPIYDIHTHLYDIPFGGLLLWGIDELITYHYLIAEVFRQHPIPYNDFWNMSKTEQADFIWKHLFLENSPVSESCRGVLTCLNKLGIDTTGRDLESIRSYFSEQTADQYVETVFKTANIESVVMTNSPFDDEERPVWEKKLDRDNRFKAALRIDPLLMDWDAACGRLQDWGYKTNVDFSKDTFSEIKRFLENWADKTAPLYMAVSLPPDFTFPENTPCGTIIENCILPFSKERNIPFAMMIGVKKLVNPQLRLAGDSVGKGKIKTIENLCAQYPDNKFMVTFLSRENQHEACIAARKYHNLMLFGCWWFLNNPSIIEEMTRERMETLGTSFIPQHSDARVLDQLIYKWDHSRSIIAKVLTDKYSDLLKTGWILDRGEIERDVSNLFSGNFKTFLART
ncbi:glucuronate isomerase [Planctomycetota bacterium]